MTDLSRRTFLTLSGAVLLNAALPFVLGQPALTAAPASIVGRALRAAPIYRRPHPDAAIIRRLWPDSVTPILGTVGRWYVAPRGVVLQDDVQPMIPYDPAMAVRPARLPAWLTVIGPTAIVRSWASGTAPLTARIGYGGVLCAVDYLPADAGGDEWYAVANAPDGSPLGWTSAARWAATDTAPGGGLADYVVRLNIRRKWLHLLQGQREILHAPASPPADARPGTSWLHRRQPVMLSPAVPPGAPWMLAGDNTALYGAYWHNAFGRQPGSAGWEVPPWLARWLYALLPDGTAIEVL